MDINDAATMVAKWASNQKQIKTVYFFGSRVRNEHRIDSDLDIAIELIYTEPDTALANWMFESEKFEQSISEMLPWTIDLELLCPLCTPTIIAGINRSSILIFSRGML